MNWLAATASFMAKSSVKPLLLISSSVKSSCARTISRALSLSETRSLAQPEPALSLLASSGTISHITEKCIEAEAGISTLTSYGQNAQSRPGTSLSTSVWASRSQIYLSSLSISSPPEKAMRIQWSSCALGMRLKPCSCFWTSNFNESTVELSECSRKFIRGVIKSLEASPLLQISYATAARFLPCASAMCFLMVMSPASYVKHMVPSYVKSLIYWIPSVWRPPLNWSLERSKVWFPVIIFSFVFEKQTYLCTGERRLAIR